MRRFGQIIGIKPEAIEDYEKLHTAIWPEVLTTIHACNIRNYSIYRYEHTLFAYFEYIGDNFAVDMAKMADDPKTQEWWSYTDPMQEALPTRQPGEWWCNLKEVFHTD